MKSCIYIYIYCYIVILLYFIDLLPDILEQRPKESDSLDTVIIVDNVPVVGPDRLEKLKSIIRKVFSKFGNVVNEFYPEQDGKTKGLAHSKDLVPSPSHHNSVIITVHRLNITPLRFINCLKPNVICIVIM